MEAKDTIPTKISTKKRMEKACERSIWGSRFIVIIAVIASIFVCIGMYCVATVDVVHLMENIFSYLHLPAGAVAEDNKSAVVASIVEIIDGYLLGTTMLIFSFGLYELFISKIDAAESNTLASRVLCIHSIDDLKERLSKLILLILIVKFFEHALKEPEISKPVDLLYFAFGIFLIGAALFLSHKKTSHHAPHPATKSVT